MSSQTIYVPRVFGGTIILTIGPVVGPVPTLVVPASFRSGVVSASFRDGEQEALYRDGSQGAGFRDGIEDATFRDGIVKIGGR